MNRVEDNKEASRYELYVDGELAGFADYYLDDGAMVFPHTEIDPPLRGRGLGEELVRAALEDARARGLRIVPDCPFVRDVMNKP